LAGIFRSGLKSVSFAGTHMKLVEDIATAAGFATDHGVKIVGTLIGELQRKRLVPPSADRIERLALKGQARVRRETAIALFDAYHLQNLTGRRGRIASGYRRHAGQPRARPADRRPGEAHEDHAG